MTALKAGARLTVALAVTLSAVACTATVPAAEPAPAAAVDREPAEGPARFAPGFRHGMVAVDGGKLHYVRGGSGPPLVLLHGWMQTWWMWRDVLPDLARDHTVVAFDLPGQGDSTTPRDGYDFRTAAARVRQAVGRLGFGRVRILAHDIGASTSYRYARDFPGEVDRMIVIETLLPGFGLEEDFGRVFHYRFLSLPAPFPEQIVDDEDVETFYGLFFDGGSRHPERVGRDVYLRQLADPAERSAGYNYYRESIVTDAEDNRTGLAGHRLRMPVLAIGGQYGHGPLVAKSFRGVADDVRAVLAPDSSHFVPEENPGFVAGCARLFLGGRPPTGAPDRSRAGCRP